MMLLHIWAGISAPLLGTSSPVSVVKAKTTSGLLPVVLAGSDVFVQGLPLEQCTWASQRRRAVAE